MANWVGGNRSPAVSKVPTLQPIPRPNRRNPNHPEARVRARDLQYDAYSSRDRSDGHESARTEGETLSRRDVMLTVAGMNAVLPPSAHGTEPNHLPGKVAPEAKMVIRVTALRGSVPAAWSSEFSTAIEGYGTVALTQKPQLADIWRDLTGEKPSKGKKPKVTRGGPTTCDVVTVGDAWLRAAITRRLIQPIPNAKEHRYWSALSPRWQHLVYRNATGMVDPVDGTVWGIPYRWGCTAVLYRRDTASRWSRGASSSYSASNRTPRIRDWDDLLLPGLKGRVAFVDSPREFVGVALKTLGLGYNATLADLARCGLSEKALSDRIRQLAGQVRVFSSVDHVRALAAGDVDVVVGWTDDLLPLAERVPAAALTVPASGTALWADMWCIPRRAAGGFEDGKPSPLLPAWLELGLQPSRARRSLRGGASPLVLPGDSETSSSQAICNPLRLVQSDVGGDLDTSMTGNGLPPDDILKRSEFLLPIDAATVAMHRRVLGVTA